MYLRLSISVYNANIIYRGKVYGGIYKSKGSVHFVYMKREEKQAIHEIGHFTLWKCGDPTY